MSRAKAWQYRAGHRGSQVTVFERPDRGGQLYARAWDGDRPIKRSLGNMTREEAVSFAEAQARRMADGAAALREGRVTVGVVLALYMEHRSPRKTARGQKSDRRAVEMWRNVLGAASDPHKVSLREWESFIRDRSAGAIDARGRPVPEGKRHPVRARTVEAACNWLRWVFGWATEWRTAQGTYLMRENPVRGFAVPKEANPRRPVATRDRYEAIRAVTDDVTMEIRWGGKVRTQRSYLSEILDIVVGTGRRIGAVCALRFRDLRLERTKAAPYGAIRWPADTDKMGRETTVPLGPDVRAAVDRILAERPGVGTAPLFPKPTDPEAPVTRYLAEKWLRKAERLAGVEPQQGGLWHPYRRMWATERKHLPVQDVAAAGGWKSAAVVQGIYQQADEATMLQVVLERGELREAK